MVYKIIGVKICLTTNPNTLITLENAAQILYGKKTKEDREQKEKRNELLSKLNGKLTPAEILYSDNKKLEKD